MQELQAPTVRVPPPVLMDDGKINGEYFRVLAAKAGPLVTNKPQDFPHDYAGERSEYVTYGFAISRDPSPLFTFVSHQSKKDNDPSATH